MRFYLFSLLFSNITQINKILMYKSENIEENEDENSSSEYKDNIRFKEIKFEYIKNEKLRNLKEFHLIKQYHSYFLWTLLLDIFQNF